MSPVDWRGDAVYAKIAQQVCGAVDEFDLEVVNAAKQELYPGPPPHGKISGTLQRSLHQERAQLQGSRVTGAIGSNLVYALRIHDLYHYFQIGLERARGLWPAILKRNLGG